jgi:hypothetical protein
MTVESPVIPIAKLNRAKTTRRQGTRRMMA